MLAHMLHVVFPHPRMISQSLLCITESTFLAVLYFVVVFTGSSLNEWFQLGGLLVCGICLYALVESLLTVISTPSGGSQNRARPAGGHNSWRIFQPPTTPYLVTNYTLNNPSLCVGSSPYFLILVHSAPQNFLARQLIRTTWGSSRSLSPKAFTRLAFLLGASNTTHVTSAVVRESAIFQGIISTYVRTHLHFSLLIIYFPCTRFLNMQIDPHD